MLKNNDNTTAKGNSVSELVLDFIRENYPEIDIEATVSDQKAWEIFLSWVAHVNTMKSDSDEDNEVIE